MLCAGSISINTVNKPASRTLDFLRFIFRSIGASLVCRALLNGPHTAASSDRLYIPAAPRYLPINQSTASAAASAAAGFLHYNMCNVWEQNDERALLFLYLNSSDVFMVPFTILSNREGVIRILCNITEVIGGGGGI